MDYQEKMLREKKLLDLWEELSKEKKSLSDLVNLKRKLHPIDFVILFQCLIVVLEKLEVYEEEIKNSPDDIVSEDIQNIQDGPVGDLVKDLLNDTDNLFGMDMIDSVLCLRVAFNNESPMSKRIEAIERIKMSAWKGMYKRKDRLLEVMTNYPDFDATKDIMTVFTCVSMIILELDMQEHEAKILDEFYNS